MSSYTRTSEQEWQWKQRSTSYAVRLFAAQGSLVWSNWVQTASGPQFGQGTRQTFEQFTTNGPPGGYEPPPALVTELKAALDAPASVKKRGWLGRLLGGRGD